MDKCFYNKQMVGKKVKFVYNGEENSGIVIEATDSDFLIQNFQTKEKFSVDMYDVRLDD